ncbi:PKD domain-containing protein [Haloplanus aerogenes]|uniref:PKD domain-containing protein n=1 Tax=Haloplanus aerogenes TaxID=660522 RepID=A0A3M0CWJ7_9EURY|nr:PKD domain-containing protein [Haloplanus aerogenes]AZH26006.1 PKD domain-containing protein [Haloplanus aerogenes]RMB11709.1 PKD repeat protein [Haloplanus aerogenes]
MTDKDLPNDVDWSEVEERAISADGGTDHLSQTGTLAEAGYTLRGQHYRYDTLWGKVYTTLSIVKYDPVPLNDFVSEYAVPVYVHATTAAVMTEYAQGTALRRYAEEFDEEDQIHMDSCQSLDISVVYPESLRGGFITKKDPDYVAQFDPAHDIPSEASQIRDRTLQLLAAEAEELVRSHPYVDTILSVKDQIQQYNNYLSDIEEILDETDKKIWNVFSVSEKEDPEPVKTGGGWVRFMLLMDPGETVELDISASGGHIGRSSVAEAEKEIEITTPDETPERQASKPTAAFDWSAETPKAGEEIQFDGSGSYDPEGESLRYSWQTYMGSQQLDSGSGETFKTTFPRAGKYPVRLTVTDESGNAGSTAKTINVAESSGEITAAFEMAPSEPLPEEKVRFTADGSTSPNGKIDSYDWEFTEQGSQRTESDSGKTVTKSFDKGVYAVSLTITDQDGATDTKSKTLSVANPPEARFSLSPKSPSVNDDISLDASTSTAPGSSISSYEWDIYRLSEETITPEPIDSTSGETITYTFDNSDEYLIELTVTNEQGVTDKTSKQVSISPAAGEQAPVARFDITPDPPNPGENIRFDATASTDPDGSITNYEWVFTDTENQERHGTATGETVSRTFPAGTYAIRLTVTDTDGNSTTEQTELAVQNQPPQASIDVEPAVPELGETVTFYSRQSRDSDGSISGHEWQLIDKAASESTTIKTSTNQRLVHTFDQAGTYSIKLTVTDDAGATDTAVVELSIDESGHEAKPTVSIAGPETVIEGERVVYTADETDPDGGTIASYTWSGPVPNTGTKTTSPRWMSTGERTISCEVTDDEGNTAQDSFTVQVKSRKEPTKDQEPTVSIAGPTQTTTNTEVTYTAEATDPDRGMPGEIAAYEWFGAVENTENEKISVEWSSPGQKAVGCRVTDDEGNTAEASITVRVEGSGPKLSINGPTKVTVGSSVTYTAEAADSDGDSIASYEWFGTFEQTQKSSVQAMDMRTLRRGGGGGRGRRGRGGRDDGKRDRDGRDDGRRGRDGDGDDDEESDSPDPGSDTISVHWTSSGQKTIGCRVTDDDGNTAESTITVQVTADELPSVSVTGPKSVNIGSRVTYTADASDPDDGTISTYEWFGDVPDSGDDTTSVRWSSTGQRTVGCRVTDNEGNTVEDSISVAVRGNQPPNAAVDANVLDPAVDQSVQFNAGLSQDPDGTITRFDWEVLKEDDDDSTLVRKTTGETFSHEFEDPGSYSVQLTVTDDDGATDTDTLEVSVQEKKGALEPKIRTPDDLIVVGEEVVFTGETPGTPIDAYSWEVFDDGDPISEGAGKTFSVSFPYPGEFDIVLTVHQGNRNARTSASVSAVQAPTAKFKIKANSPPAPGDQVVFDASHSLDPDGEIRNYDWEFQDLSSATVYTASGETVKRTFNTGTYSVVLTVRDQDGLTDSHSRTLTITRPPVAEFTVSPKSPIAGEDLTVDASESYDPDGSITSYDWEFEKAGPNQSEFASGETVTRTFEKGKYEVTLSVTDEHGGTDTATKSINIEGGSPPTAQFDVTPDSPTTGEEITLDGSDSDDPDGTIEQYQWRVRRGTEVMRKGTGATFTFSGSPGTYEITLIVTDDSGQTDKAGRSVTVEDSQAPTAAFDITPAEPVAGEEVTLDASESDDPDGAIQEYSWEIRQKPFQNPELDSGEVITRTFSKGTYAVTLIVSDDDGKTGRTTETLTVAAGSKRPIAMFDVTPASPREGDDITVDAGDSEDPDGTIEEYQWRIERDATTVASGSGETFTFTADTDGTHDIEFTVTDNDGQMDTAQQSVSVASREGTVRLSAEQTQVSPMSSTTIEVTAEDADGDPVEGASVELSVSSQEVGGQTGELSRSSVTTDASGTASVTYTAPFASSSSDNIEATWKGASDTVIITTTLAGLFV